MEKLRVPLLVTLTLTLLTSRESCCTRLQNAPPAMLTTAGLMASSSQLPPDPYDLVPPIDDPWGKWHPNYRLYSSSHHLKDRGRYSLIRTDSPYLKNVDDSPALSITTTLSSDLKRIATSRDQASNNLNIQLRFYDRLLSFTLLTLDEAYPPTLRKRPWALPDPLHCCLLRLSCCRRRAPANYS
ncbi:unnamed protein product [Hydatigera taeniaeformis]|uniref:Glyco_hydro_38C domain-containing protein n=1 Tax=Hydatigena taeniaeformis TaxID=6205 RepID=A0A0R3WNU6_HYDTA|nr:unnamed protein product [Hydatigera taeniaeformis]